MGDNTKEKKQHRTQIGGVWHVLVMVGYHRGWPEWHWIREEEHANDKLLAESELKANEFRSQNIV